MPETAPLILHHAIPLCLALAISWSLSAHLSGTRARLRFMDLPNERSLHRIPTPRTGGVAILAGIIAALCALVLSGQGDLHLFKILPGTALVAAISLCDDRVGIPAAPRFAVHALAAGLAVLGGDLILSEPRLGSWTWSLHWVWPSWVALVFTLLFVVWMINLYNFMDGMDGFAAGMALIGFGFLGLFGWLAGESGYALICWSIALACLGFLFSNFPPARIFMGDTGASSLGFLAAVLILWPSVRGVFPFWAGVLVFSPFIVDATVTLLRRLLRGEKIWQAHRGHYYQRLVQLGWGHRKTVLAEYILMLVAGGCALLLLYLRDTLWLLSALSAWCALYALLMLIIRRLEQKFQAAAYAQTTLTKE
jgi:UDP-N-acetylmuramyl pentapeptide phosphotransferase/UDP-N-acetylglucosamine-1-phosphate transferase